MVLDDADYMAVKLMFHGTNAYHAEVTDDELELIRANVRQQKTMPRPIRKLICKRMDAI